MEHKVSIASGKQGMFIKIDEATYNRFFSIPPAILNELSEEQKETVRQFFGVNDDPRGDKKKVFGQ